jgi:protein required for attachment to host cells
MKTWILVADAGRARLFEAQSRDGVLAEIGGYANPEAHARGAETGSDRPPRTQESANSARHAIEPHTDAHDKAAMGFAKGLAEILEHGRVEHAYTRLLLVAPPRFLGQLRAELGAQVGKLVAGSIAKDLTHATNGDIRAVLDEV